MTLLKVRKEPTRPDNRRRIRLLPVIGKLCESIKGEQLTICAATNSILPSLQFGVRRKLAAAYQTTNLDLPVRPNLGLCCQVVVALLVVVEAYDKVWHDGLLRKLQASMALIKVLRCPVGSSPSVMALCC